MEFEKNGNNSDKKSDDDDDDETNANEDWNLCTKSSAEDDSFVTASEFTTTPNSSSYHTASGSPWWGLEHEHISTSFDADSLDLDSQLPSLNLFNGVMAATTTKLSFDDSEHSSLSIEKSPIYSESTDLDEAKKSSTDNLSTDSTSSKENHNIKEINENIKELNENGKEVEDISNNNFKSGDIYKIKVIDLEPKLTFLGVNLDEALSMQKEYDEMLRQIQEKNTPLEEFEEKLKALIIKENPRPEILNAMRGSMELTWSDINKMLLERKFILDQNVNFHEKLEECRGKMSALEMSCRDTMIPIEIDSVLEYLEKFKQLRTDVLTSVMSALKEGSTMIDRLKRLLEIGSLDSRPEYLKNETVKSVTLVETLLEDLHDKRNALELAWQTRKTQLEQCYALAVLAKDIIELEDLIEKRRSEVFNSFSLGDSETTADLLLQTHKTARDDAVHLRDKALKITKSTEHLVQTGCFAGDQASHKAYHVLSNATDYYDEIDRRETLLEQAKDFFHKAESVLNVLEKLEIEVSTTKLEPNSEELLNFHNKILKELDGLIDEPVSLGNKLLEIMHYKHPESAGVKRTVEEMENRKIYLQNVCSADSERSMQISHALNIFMENYNNILSWLISIAEEFLKTNNKMGVNDIEGRSFLNLHHQLLYDLEIKGNEVNNILLTLPPILEHLSEDQRKDIDKKVESLHAHWSEIKRLVESRVDLVELFIKFHTEAENVFKMFEFIENLLKITDDKEKLHQFEEAWSQVKPVYAELKNIGNQFTKDAPKVADPYLDLKKSTQSIEEILNNISNRSFDITECWENLTSTIVTKHDTELILEKMMTENIRAMSATSKLDAQLYPVLNFPTDEAIELKHHINDKLENVTEEITKAQNEIKQRLETIKQLESHDLETQEKIEQMNNNLNAISNKLEVILRDYKNLLDGIMDYLYGLHETKKVIEDYFKDKEKVPEENLESLYQDYNIFKETTMEKFRTLIAQSQFLVDRVHDQEPHGSSEYDAERIISLLEKLRVIFETQNNQKASSFQKQQMISTFNRDLTEINKNLDDMFRQLNDVRSQFGDSPASAKATSLAFEYFEQTIDLLEKRIDGISKNADIISRNFPDTELTNKIEMEKLQSKWLNFREHSKDTRQLIDVANEYFNLYDKVDSKYREHSTYLFNTVNKLPHISTVDEASNLIQSIDSYVGLNEKPQMNDLKNLQKLSIQIFGSDKTQQLYNDNESLFKSFSKLKSDISNIIIKFKNVENGDDNLIIEENKIVKDEVDRKIEQHPQLQEMERMLSQSHLEIKQTQELPKDISLQLQPLIINEQKQLPIESMKQLNDISQRIEKEHTTVIEKHYIQQQQIVMQPNEVNSMNFDENQNIELLKKQQQIQELQQLQQNQLQEQQMKLQQQYQDLMQQQQALQQQQQKFQEQQQQILKQQLLQQQEIIHPPVQQHQEVHHHIQHHTIETHHHITNENGTTPVNNPQPPVFKQTLKSVTIQEGSKLTFTCLVHGNPEPKIEWFKDGVSIQGNPDYKTTYNNGICTLSIEETFTADSAQFTCKATNPFGYAETTSNLNVKETSTDENFQPPTFVKYLTSSKAKEGSSFEFHCIVTGNPLPDIQWFKNDTCIDNSKDYMITYNNGEAVLRFEEVFLEDKALYICRATNSVGSDQCWANLDVEPLEPTELPRFIQHLSNVMARVGQKIKLECAVTGIPRPEIYWTHNQKPFNLRNAKLQYENERATLVINEAFPKDAGLYIVTAKNIAGEISSACNVSVKGRLPNETSDSELASDMEPIKPSVQLELNDISVSEGKSVRLDCVIIGQPEPEVIWYHNKRPVKESQDFQLLFQGDRCSLLIQETFLEDTGEYCVVAINSAGEASSKCNLSVIPLNNLEPVTRQSVQMSQQTQTSAPSFEKLLIDQLAPEGEIVEFECNVQGVPKPNITWYLNNKPIPDGDFRLNKIQQNDGTVKLIINNVTPNDKGLYTVKASNPLGEVKCFSHLIVKSVNASDNYEQTNEIEDKFLSPTFKELFSNKIHSENDTAKFECIVVGKPTPKIKWYFNDELVHGKDFLISTSGDRQVLIIPSVSKETCGKIACVAENDAGKATCVAYLTLSALGDNAPGSQTDVQSLTQEHNTEVSSVTIKKQFITSTSSSQVSSSNIENGLPQTQIHKTLHTSEKSMNQFGNDEPEIKETQQSQEYHQTNTLPPVIEQKSTITITKNIMGQQQTQNGHVTDGNAHPAPLHFPKSKRKTIAPRFVSPFVGKIVDQGVDVKFEAILDGFPSPDIKIVKNGEELFGNEKISIEHSLNKVVVEVKNVNTKDAGRYSCIAQNAAGSSTSTADLVVKKSIFPPVFGRRLQAQVVKKGERVIMEVEITGTPEPTVSWFKDSQPLKEVMKSDYKVKQCGMSHILIIEKAQFHDSGKYMVKATNSGGEAQSLADFAVLEPTPERMVEVVKTVVFDDVQVNEGKNESANFTNQSISPLHSLNQTVKIQSDPHGNEESTIITETTRTTEATMRMEHKLTFPDLDSILTNKDKPLKVSEGTMYEQNVKNIATNTETHTRSDATQTPSMESMIEKPNMVEIQRMTPISSQQPNSQILHMKSEFTSMQNIETSTNQPFGLIQLSQSLKTDSTQPTPKPQQMMMMQTQPTFEQPQPQSQTYQMLEQLQKLTSTQSNTQQTFENVSSPQTPSAFIPIQIDQSTPTSFEELRKQVLSSNTNQQDQFKPVQIYQQTQPQDQNITQSSFQQTIGSMQTFSSFQTIQHPQPQIPTGIGFLEQKPIEIIQPQLFKPVEPVEPQQQSFEQIMSSLKLDETIQPQPKEVFKPIESLKLVLPEPQPKPILSQFEHSVTSYSTQVSQPIPQHTQVLIKDDAPQEPQELQPIQSQQSDPPVKHLPPTPPPKTIPIKLEPAKPIYNGQIIFQQPTPIQNEHRLSNVELPKIEQIAQLEQLAQQPVDDNNIETQSISKQAAFEFFMNKLKPESEDSNEKYTKFENVPHQPMEESTVVKQAQSFEVHGTQLQPGTPPVMDYIAPDQVEVKDESVADKINKINDISQYQESYQQHIDSYAVNDAAGRPIYRPKAIMSLSEPFMENRGLSPRPSAEGIAMEKLWAHKVPDSEKPEEIQQGVVLEQKPVETVQTMSQPPIPKDSNLKAPLLVKNLIRKEEHTVIVQQQHQPNLSELGYAPGTPPEFGYAHPFAQKQEKPSQNFVNEPQCQKTIVDKKEIPTPIVNVHVENISKPSMPIQPPPPPPIEVKIKEPKQTPTAPIVVEKQIKSNVTVTKSVPYPAPPPPTSLKYMKPEPHTESDIESWKSYESDNEGKYFMKNIKQAPAVPMRAQPVQPPIPPPPIAPYPVSSGYMADTEETSFKSFHSFHEKSSTQSQYSSEVMNNQSNLYVAQAPKIPEKPIPPIKHYRHHIHKHDKKDDNITNTSGDLTKDATMMKNISMTSKQFKYNKEIDFEPTAHPAPIVHTPVEQKKKVKIPLPPSPSKFVKGEFKESDYESDYDSRIQPMWRPYDSDSEPISGYKPVRFTPQSRSYYSDDGRSVTPPTEFDRPPHFDGPPRPKFEPIEKHKTTTTTFKTDKTKQQTTSSQSFVHKPTPVAVKIVPPKQYIPSEPPRKEVKYYTAIAGTPIHTANFATETTNSVQMKESSENCHRVVNMTQTRRVIPLEPFTYQPDGYHGHGRTKQKLPPPPTPTKFIKGEFRESDYESEVESARIRPVWTPNPSDSDEPRFRPVQPPRPSRATSLPRTNYKGHIISPLEFDRNPPHYDHRNYQHTQTIDRFKSKKYYHDHKALVTRDDIDLKPGSPPQYGYIAGADEQMQSMNQSFKSKAQHFIQDLCTPRQKTILKKTVSDSGGENQAYREESRVSQYGTKHIDPNTGLIYFKYDFGYEFGILFPGEGRKFISGQSSCNKEALPFKSSVSLQSLNRPDNVEVPVFHEKTKNYNNNTEQNVVPPYTYDHSKKRFSLPLQYNIDQLSQPNYNQLVQKQTRSQDPSPIRRQLHRNSMPPPTIQPIVPVNANFNEQPKKPPMFITPLKDIAVVSGQMARFECIVQCDPHPDIYWMRNGCHIENSPKTHIEFRNGVCRLCLPNAFPGDAGTYTCTAQNQLGSVSTSGELLVPGDNYRK